jgi:hypothetical protein
MCDVAGLREVECLHPKIDVIKKHKKHKKIIKMQFLVTILRKNFIFSVSLIAVRIFLNITTLNV